MNKVWVEIPVSDASYRMTEELARMRGVTLEELHWELIEEVFTSLLQRARSEPAGDV